MKHLTNAELADWLDDYIENRSFDSQAMAEISERLRASAVPARTVLIDWRPILAFSKEQNISFGEIKKAVDAALEKPFCAAPEPRIAAEAALPSDAGIDVLDEVSMFDRIQAARKATPPLPPAQPTSGKLSLADVGVTPQGTPQHMLDRAAQPLPVAAVALTNEQDELQTRLRSMAATLTNIASDPMWANRAEISKRTLLRAAECLQIGLTALQPTVALTDALKDAVAHLVGAASAYRTYAKRHISQGKAETDAFFSTRINDFDAAVERGRAALEAAVHAKLGEPAAPVAAQLLPVAAVALTEAIDALEVLNRRPRPMCRDCADGSGKCPSNGLSCDMRAVIANARAALEAAHKIGDKS